MKTRNVYGILFGKPHETRHVDREIDRTILISILGKYVVK
jgi:hypothetical protein